MGDCLFFLQLAPEGVVVDQLQFGWMFVLPWRESFRLGQVVPKLIGEGC